jgi:hypothetical protein
MASSAGLQLEVLPPEPGCSSTLVRCMAPAAAAVAILASASTDAAMHDADGAAAQTDMAGSAQSSEAQLTMLVRLPPDYAENPAAAAPSAEFMSPAEQQVIMRSMTADVGSCKKCRSSCLAHAICLVDMACSGECMCSTSFAGIAVSAGHRAAR